MTRFSMFQVLCWGVRNMKKFQLSSVTSPSIEFEVSGNVVESTMIKNTKRNPNFTDPILFFDVVSVDIGHCWPSWILLVIAFPPLPLEEFCQNFAHGFFSTS